MNRIRSIGDKGQHFLIRWRRIILLLVASAVGAFEFYEHPDFLSDSTYYLFKELAIYFGLLIIIAFMIELVIKANLIKNQTIRVLNARHSLSMQLTAAKDWDEVVAKTLQYPSSILPVSASSLLIYDETMDCFITERSWMAENEKISITRISIPKDACCTDDIRLISPNIHLVNGETIVPANDKKRVCYHMALDYGATPIGVLYLVLPERQHLANEHIQLLSNTAEDIAIGLHAAKQRQLQHESELANAATNERLEIARDLHDTLGQNLGYLHFKLDQILANSTGNTYRINLSELERLRELANESYELVRSTLVILQHKSDHRISELFNAHTQIIAKRTGIPVSIDEEGLSRSLPPYYLKQLLFAFKESLYNIERHSGASQAKVSLIWTETQLKVRIWDDGRGFEVNQPANSGHYGLGIIDDRIKSLDGKVEINSSLGEGTELMFWLPLTISDKEPANKQVGEL